MELGAVLPLSPYTYKYETYNILIIIMSLYKGACTVLYTGQLIIPPTAHEMLVVFGF